MHKDYIQPLVTVVKYNGNGIGNHRDVVEGAKARSEKESVYKGDLGRWRKGGGVGNRRGWGTTGEGGREWWGSAILTCGGGDQP